MTPAVDSFEFAPGRVLSGKYEIVSFLGGGWEGEAYLVRERPTGIERAAKLFYPHRNVGDRTAKVYAKRLHRLRDVPIIFQYHTQESMRYRGLRVTYLVSEFVEGERLSDFLARQPRGRLPPFTALHLLYALARGLEPVHRRGEYHGDLHTDNVIVQRFGLEFQLKVLDIFHWPGAKRESIRDDVVEMIRIFHDALGGASHYARQPPEVKAICRGLKRSLISERFRTAGHLRAHIESMTWR